MSDPGEENKEDERDVLAAEYVLGTLDADDRANAQMLMAIDPSFVAAIARWEAKLGELSYLVEPVEPAATNWEWIKARVASVPSSGQVWLPGLDEAASAASRVPSEPLPFPVSVPSAPPRGVAADLSRRVRRWQRLTVAATALAASIAGVAVLREVRPVLLPEVLRPKVVERVVEVVRTVEVPSQRIAEFVAVFQRDDSLPAPAFLLTVDVERRTLSLRRVGAELLSDQAYELWIATAREPRPRSLGVVAQEEFTVRRALDDYDAPTLHGATFGISQEPPGGSPTGQPTGPVIHGRLIQATPAAFPQMIP